MINQPINDLFCKSSKNLVCFEKKKPVGSHVSLAPFYEVLLFSCHCSRTRVLNDLAVSMNFARFARLLGLVSRLCIKMFNCTAQII